jgi:hypothetical protein
MFVDHIEGKVVPERIAHPSDDEAPDKNPVLAKSKSKSRTRSKAASRMKNEPAPDDDDDDEPRAKSKTGSYDQKSQKSGNRRSQNESQIDFKFDIPE